MSDTDLGSGGSGNPGGLNRKAIALVVGVGFALFALAYGIEKFLSDDTTYLLRTEDGLIEKGTLWVYGVAVVLALFICVVKRWRFGIYIAIVIGLTMMRELDLDIRQGADGVAQKLNSTRYWRSPEFPVLEKILIGAALLAAAYAGVKLLRSGLPGLWRDLKVGVSYPVTVIGIGAFVALSQIMDNRVETGNLDDPIVMYFSLAEECIELGIPILICIALVQVWPTAGKQAIEGEREVST
jgi:hypothetical protein